MAALGERRQTTGAVVWGSLLGRLRLASGLVLFVYVLTHLLNHAVGIWSLSALNSTQAVFVAVWRHPLGSFLLYGALAVHVLIALRAVWRRDSFRAMGRAEIAQLGLGLAIPLLLLDHAIGTRYVHETFGVADGYTYVLLNMWVFAPTIALKQSLALLVAWDPVARGSRSMADAFRARVAAFEGLA